MNQTLSCLSGSGNLGEVKQFSFRKGHIHSHVDMTFDRIHTHTHTHTHTHPHTHTLLNFFLNCGIQYEGVIYFLLYYLLEAGVRPTMLIWWIYKVVKRTNS